MDTAAIIMAFLSIALSCVRISLGIWLFCAPLPHRDNFGIRAALTLLALFALDVVLSSVFFGNAAVIQSTGFYVAQFIVFPLLLIACVYGLTRVYDTNMWTALFCCSAGYTVQNLASGMVELLWSLRGGANPYESYPLAPERLVIAFACTALVYGATYVFITRPLLRYGFRRIEERRMLVMMAVTILVIIGFDIVIKYLTDTGIPTIAMVLLRLFHGLACVFTIVMEFELLIRRHVEAERDTLAQVLTEHERQYTLARENVSAINARVHDIRHMIAHMADESGVDKLALREMVRAVDVYDSALKTGNEALDVALTERRLACAHSGVELACITDGKLLDFMSAADVYVLVTALIDAALAAGGEALSFTVQERMGALVIRLTWQGADMDENRLAEVVDITNRYKGISSAQSEGDTQYVSLLFPAKA